MRLRAPLAFVALAAALSGCGPHFGRVELQSGELPEDVHLPSAAAVFSGYGPARVLVHPLSRFEGTGDARRAVVDVQLIDAFGHDLKWPGVLRVEVAVSESFDGASARWLDLTDPDVNARAYDSISRCYPVRVPAAGTGPVFARVRWVMGNGDGGVAGLDAVGQITPGK